MGETYESIKDQSETDLYDEIEALIKNNPRSWQSACAVFGLAGCVIAPFLGATSDVITWFVSSPSINSRLNVLSVVSCALTIPLLLLGAFSLDSLETKTQKTEHSFPTESLCRDLQE